MKCKALMVEDFVNYKKPNLFLGIGTCDYKCCHEANIPITICQNSTLAQTKDRYISNDKIIEMYLSNPITEAIVIGGLEPMRQFEDMLDFISEFRKISQDDIVIYTGYYEYEIKNKIKQLQQYKNIIVKFGRFVPNDSKHYDEILGITLVSTNQYAKKIS